MPSPDGLRLAMVGHLPDVAVILVHALGHHPHAQPEAQDEILTRCDAVDLMLRPDELCKDHLPAFVKLFCELAFVTGDTVYRPL